MFFQIQNILSLFPDEKDFGSILQNFPSFFELINGFCFESCFLLSFFLLFSTDENQLLYISRFFFKPLDFYRALVTSNCRSKAARSLNFESVFLNSFLNPS